ncbi:MAG: coiled-coil domain-containing protein [Thermoplasmata archaeon]
MDFDGFVSFMARYNAALYPTHDNLWMRIHLINPQSLKPSTAKAFKTFKFKLSKAVRNLSQDDLEKLINMKDGRMRPHPNTFILKKFGISTRIYETIRYAAFNHARHLSVSQNLPPVPRIQKSVMNSTQDALNQIIDAKLQSISTSISSVQDKISSDAEKKINAYITQELKSMESSIADEVTNRSYEMIEHELDKAIESINKNKGNTFAVGMLGGTIGGAFVTLIEKLFNKDNMSDLSEKVNAISNRLADMENEVKSLKMTLSYLKNITDPFLNLEDGYNYLKAFGVPITKADWDKLSDVLKRSWSPYHIKPPLTDGRRKAIAESIKRNEPPTVGMCYDLG